MVFRAKLPRFRTFYRLVNLLEISQTCLKIHRINTPYRFKPGQWHQISGKFLRILIFVLKVGKQ